MQKQRSKQEIRENMIAVAVFISRLEKQGPEFEPSCMQAFHRVSKGEVGSQTCIRDIKRLLEKQQQAHAPR